MPLVTSNTYDFQNLENDELIIECFERIGISGEQLVPVKLNSARRSLNLLLLDWISRSTNLWTLNTGYLALNTGQSKYVMNSIVTDILQVNLRTFTRQLNGTAATSNGGVAANAFDGNLTTACTQNAIDGNISYDYGADVGQQINFVGIRSNETLNYTVIIESSVDNVNWLPLLVIPQQEYVIGITKWFDIIAPVNVRAYRIRETGGLTLNIQEIYFTNNILDLKLSPVSRDTYLSFSQKFIQGKPSCYYLDKQITPVLNIWYPPLAMYQVLQYSYISVMQDAGGFYNVADVPSRMYPALTWGLSWMLAVKYNPQVAMDMKNEYEQAFSLAAANDSENVDMTIGVDIGGYYEN